MEQSTKVSYSRCQKPVIDTNIFILVKWSICTFGIILIINLWSHHKYRPYKTTLDIKHDYHEKVLRFFASTPISKKLTLYLGIILYVFSVHPSLGDSFILTTIIPVISIVIISQGLTFSTDDPCTQSSVTQTCRVSEGETDSDKWANLHCSIHKCTTNTNSSNISDWSVTYPFQVYRAANCKIPSLL